MSDNTLSTESYKGVRDFYPEEMAIQQFIFRTWGATAESFGFEHYDASILEPAELYKNKGAENEEIIHEQSYTFTDRGEREVTLRPEMTPTVARMVAGRRRDLQFPVRWYSIPNLFRYERPQRGRLREHWQLNCDLFGGDPVAADVEIIALAHTLLTDFGATADMFEIRINDRAEMQQIYTDLGITDTDTQNHITRLNDRFHKISADEYTKALQDILNNEEQVQQIYSLVAGNDTTDHNQVVTNLKTLGITNVVIDRSIARGFNYYTGTIFELFDISGKNNRAMLGGGRYDNLTAMFGGDPISGVGFGMGDVTMRDFLETHNLLPESVRSTAAHLTVIPMTAAENLSAEHIAHQVRQAGFSVATDIGTKKVGEKIGRASEKGTKFICVIGENEVQSNTLTFKNLSSGAEQSGQIGELMNFLSVA